MSTYAEKVSPLQNMSELSTETSSPELRGGALLGGGSLAAASIEAICTFFVALSKLGILVGFTSFLSTVIVSRFHADWVRVPVLGVALAGAVLNLVVLRNRMKLRNAPAAAWRKRPLTRAERWRIAGVIVMSTVTIALVVGEFWLHPFHGF